MRRWLPFPVLTVGLLALWLLLSGSMAPGTIILGGALAIGAAQALTALDPPKTRFRRPRAALRLALVVLAEVVRSNNAVARIILRPGARHRRSGFVRIPLDMRAPYGLAALACIITATPGTIWVEYDSADNTMLLHVLDLIDEEEWVRIIKNRYETRLMEIFE
ncbi:Na+/H+ antiporter subunit E [Skermanella rosea]|uniref:Na+/H+ antiporter subunit E n=1 Tax=Skermanella rosea TaxID=1817965 RepID=UPI00193192A2|nr:Na+/H+ antiporter subunit E [Skermanella rosea]UEM03432.1 Na+/H+ antiporter subunit E [Skermanella rosea]